jgi:hypothetical protein
MMLPLRRFGDAVQLECGWQRRDGNQQRLIRIQYRLRSRVSSSAPLTLSILVP